MLSEDQIQRYSRQILLRGVGGRGQAALLSGQVEVVAAGAATAVAATYLGASGVKVRWSGGEVSPGEPGFLFGQEELGRPRTAAGATHLAALNPDAVAEPPAGPALLLTEGRALPGVPQVLLCAEGEGALVIAATEEACAACLAATSTEAPPSVPSAAGAFAALVVQQLLLRRTGAPLRAWRLSAAGTLAEHAPTHCPRCAPTGTASP